MKPTIIIAAALFTVLPQPAWACHRFRMWAYPFPQRCSYLYHAPIRTYVKDEQTYYVEVTKLPEITPEVLDEISHGVGIEKIKKLNENVQ